MTATSFLEHADQPFRVSGILAPTGTPVDRSVHILLEGMEAIHEGWEDGTPPAFGARPANSDTDQDDQAAVSRPTRITAFLLGLRSTVGLFALQREINEHAAEPLSAILPTATLVEVWKMVDVANAALQAVAVFVVLAGLMGMVSMVLATLEQRRREIAILRAAGARPRHVFSLLIAEAGLLTAAGGAFGIGLLFALGWLAVPIVESRFGLSLEVGALSVRDLAVYGAIIACGMLAGALPGWRAYWRSLGDGLVPRQ